jgi:hypothetical protein
MMHNHWSQTLETLIDWLALNDTLGDAVVVRRLMDVLNARPTPPCWAGCTASMPPPSIACCPPMPPMRWCCV